MNTQLKLAALTLLLAIDNLQLSTAFAQGSLTPSGAPAPTMKTLDQIQPRTPVDTTHTPGNANNLFIIGQSGSYYLTTNITGVANKNGISIQADNVALDLGGFTLFGGATNSQAGILVSGTHVALTIRNGTVRDWSGNGIAAGNTGSSEFERLHTTANGGVGIKVGSRNTIGNCIAAGNSGDGIDTGAYCALADCLAVSNVLGIATGAGCRLRGCAADNNSSVGISTGDDCLIEQSVTIANVLGGIGAGKGCSLLGGTVVSNTAPGVIAGSGCTIKDISVLASGSLGISAGDRSSVVNCTASGSGDSGISVGMNCSVLGCTAVANAAYGIGAGAGCTIKDSTADTNLDGIVAGSECTIVNCTVSANNGDGIQVAYSCLVKDNTCASNSRYVVTGGAGIHVINNGNRIEGNLSNSDQYGIKVDAGENLVFHNSVRFAISANYNIVAGNKVGTVLLPPLSGAINGTTGGAGFGTTDPWTNFSF